MQVLGLVSLVDGHGEEDLVAGQAVVDQAAAASIHAAAVHPSVVTVELRDCFTFEVIFE